ncbi:Hypothetical Protein FCC1311_114532 [Hondaea fermentalgiana]|uniref:Uncharacterized protein n=1 Tax=Hondaea fermentalgiana TaxID=2315210 RepID=A0A2R5GWM5_9STRA|nr:Hypothetical Protein FCC1311_114532 [Hondaea fermentalgiana]|eukprot:GBG35230.1 Hypothetical Protein FCC1311_114532 [Hondaea fermentalgiana]
MSAQPTQAQVAKFGEDVKAMVTAQDKIRAIAARAKEDSAPFKEAFKAAEKDVTNFIRSSAIDVCSYQEEKIEFKTATRAGSLTRKTLLGPLEKYFGNAEDAAKCLEAVNEIPGQREVDVVRRKKKRAPAKNKKRKTAAAKQEEEEEEEDNDLTDTNTTAATVGGSSNDDDDEDDEDMGVAHAAQAQRGRRL